ncbi:hypothetical protein TrST_g10700 [Triparma strigata]|uniref:Glycerophosphocholine acyltransferase 1 n=1 Tax=Triparma strigata TaxID=1606541 RepID=A0A9W7E3D4_9STRA|nr:hypothetical protein TrST_g10700 [Triparma strigata]
MSTGNRLPFTHSQNNFGTAKGRIGERSAVDKNEGQAQKSKDEERKFRKQRALARLEQRKKPSKYDRFGRPLDSSQTTPYAAVFSSTPARGPSSGNKFAPSSSSSKEKSLKRGHGIKYTMTFLLVVGYFYLLFEFPHYIPYYYIATLMPLFLYRYVSYYLINRQHFTIEICYFINYLLMVYILVYPDDYKLFFGVFTLSMSVGIGSTIILSFKMVFGDLQTFINAYMHVAPAITSFAIRFVITSETPIKFNVCKSSTKCDELKTFESSMEWFFVYPIAFYGAHMVLYNFWVWVVPHPKLHRRKNYCNTFIKAMSGGFGNYLVRILSCGGKRWALWVYNLIQLVWAAAFLVIVSPFYYNFYASSIYLSVLFVSILLNGGSFYSYKIKKLKSVEEKLKDYEEEDEDTVTNFFDEENADEEIDYDGKWAKTGRKGKRRTIATVIRTTDSFTVQTTAYGRAHRAKMSKMTNHGKKVRVAHLASAPGKDDKPGDHDTEEYVGKLAMHRRLESKSSSRPEL